MSVEMFDSAARVILLVLFAGVAAVVWALAAHLWYNR